MALRSVSKSLAQNIMSSRSLKDNTITIYSKFHHSDTSRELPTILQISRKYPATDWQIFIGNGQSNGRPEANLVFCLSNAHFVESFFIFLISFQISRTIFFRNIFPLTKNGEIDISATVNLRRQTEWISSSKQHLLCAQYCLILEMQEDE